MGRGRRRLHKIRRPPRGRSLPAQSRQPCEVTQMEERRQQRQRKEHHRQEQQDREQLEQQQQELRELLQENPVLLEFEELARREVNRVFHMLFDYAVSISEMSKVIYMKEIRGRKRQVTGNDDERSGVRRIQIDNQLLQEALNRVPVGEEEADLRKLLNLFKDEDLIGVALHFRERSQDPEGRDPDAEGNDPKVEFKERHLEDKVSDFEDKGPDVEYENPEAAVEDANAESEDSDGE
ncbi:hypothetical protein TSMEX_008056, partial [Taenia solium]|eukprot:TsM_001227400 transcript=TsM_001227400 gene=TsM_001227400